jgi:hypothetical protein
VDKRLAWALGAVAVAGAAVGALILASGSKPSAPSGGVTPAPGGGNGGSGVKPSSDPWGDLKTQIQILDLSANNLRADTFVNHPTVWAVWVDAGAVMDDANNLMTNPAGQPLKPPASAAGLATLNTDVTKLFQDSAAASTAALVPASTKVLVAAVAAATLGVSRAASTAGV